MTAGMTLLRGFNAFTRFGGSSTVTLSTFDANVAGVTFAEDTDIDITNLNAFKAQAVFNISSETPTVGTHVGFLADNLSFATTNRGFEGQLSAGTGKHNLYISGTADNYLGTGNTGISTTSPASKLDVWGDLRVGTSSTPTLFVRTSNERVGIGTSLPQAKLEVVDSNSDENILFDVSTAGFAEISTGAFGSDLRFHTQQGVGLENTDQLVLHNSGNVGVGTSSPWAMLSASGTVALHGLSKGGGDALCLTSGSEVLVNIGATDCMVSSARFKENIEGLTVGLDELMRLRPVSFTYKNDTTGNEHIGLIAEEVEEVEERLVFYGEDERVRGVRYTEMVALLVRAIQELTARVDQLAAAIGSGISNTIDLIVERLTVGSPEKPSGITLYDEKTGEPYCLSVRGGTTITRSGACGEVYIGGTSGGGNETTLEGGNGSEDISEDEEATPPETEDGEGGEESGETDESVDDAGVVAEEYDETAVEPETDETELAETQDSEVSEGGQESAEADAPSEAEPGDAA
jgi:hypothetical protein